MKVFWCWVKFFVVPQKIAFKESVQLIDKWWLYLTLENSTSLEKKWWLKIKLSHLLCSMSRNIIIYNRYLRVLRRNASTFIEWCFAMQCKMMTVFWPFLLLKKWFRTSPLSPPDEHSLIISAKNKISAKAKISAYEHHAQHLESSPKNV